MTTLERSNARETGFSPLSPKFQPSVDRIPSPGSGVDRPPHYEPLVLHSWFVAGVALLMIALGIALQVALHVSNIQNGFAVPAKNVFSIVSTQFLTSFFPSLFVVPLAFFWDVADGTLRCYQPYMTLAQGESPAARSILLDYVALSRFAVFYYSWIYKHYLIHVSSLMAFTLVVLRPLASSVFQVRPVPYTSNATALVTGTIGLSPTIDSLDTFFASAGFALASVYDNLVDPPFVHQVWTTAPFQAPPGSYLNGTLAINTTAIQTHVNCVSPSSLNVSSVNGSYTASATFPGGCSASNVFNPANGDEQYNVVNASSCASSGTDIVFQPVVFWFYLDTSSPQVASVYCSPTMKVFTVGTSMDLSNSALGPCTIIEPAQGTNNVTGSPQNGRPYNGVVFNQSTNAYVSSRASAINFGIPDAIFRYATQQPGGPSSVFEDQYGFLNATTAIYTQHLAVAAQSGYFLEGNLIIPAGLTSNVQRLFVEALPTHFLSVLLIVIGLVGFVVHYLHSKARRQLWLASPPGSIAAIVSLTSRSGFGELLLPYDDERRMADSLAGLTFRLDRRTGAIVAEEDLGMSDGADGVALLGRKRPYDHPTYTVDGDSPASPEASFKASHSA